MGKTHLISRRCPKCDTPAPIWDAVCLECGFHMLSPSWLRFGGILFVIMGTPIAVTIIYIMWWMAGVMLHNSNPDARYHFSGTPLQAIGIFALLSAVAMFGVTYVAMGIWWIMRGTRSHLLIRLGIIGYVLVAAGFAFLQWSSN